MKLLHFGVALLLLAAGLAHAQQGPAASAPAPAASAATGSAAENLYAVEIRTGPAWQADKPPQQQAFFREHSAHLRMLREQGRLVMGARYGELGLLVLQAATRAQAEALMAADPSMQHGTFRCEVHEFNVFYGGTLQPRPRRPG